MIRSLAVAFTVSVAVAALGGGPPSQPPVITGPPPVLDPTARPEWVFPPAIINGPARESILSQTSSTAFFVAREGRRNTSQATATTTAEPTILRRTNPGRLAMQTTAVPNFPETLYSANASNLAGPDIEASIVALNRNFTSVVTSASFNLQLHDSHNHFRVRANSAVAPTSNAATFNSYLFGLGAGYTDNFDPVLAVNPETDGIRPGAAYAAFVLANQNEPNGGFRNPTAIQVFGSPDGGQTWDTASPPWWTTATDPYIVDKPSIDVSRFSATRGYIYVAWLEDFSALNGNANNNRIVLRRNTGGLFSKCSSRGCVHSWDNPVRLSGDGTAFLESAGMPQVVVNHNTGAVYVFWNRFNGTPATSIDIRMRRTLDGVNWSDPITVVQGILPIAGVGGFRVLPNGLRAAVVPTIEFDTANNQVVAVWHSRSVPEPPTGTNEIDIYFARFDASTVTGPVPMTAIITAPGSQIQPAIDNDNAGRLLVTYMSTQNSPTQTTYEPFAVCLNNFGMPISGCGPQAFAGAGAHPNGFIGDYHETYFWNLSDALGARWNTAWTGTVNGGQYDIMVSGIR